MEQAPPLAQPAASALRLKNAAAAALLVALTATLYAVAPWNGKVMGNLYVAGSLAFTGASFLIVAALTYALIVCAFFLTERRPGVSKSLRCLRVAARAARAPTAAWRDGLAPADRLAVLTTLLKAFFGPMMAVSLMIFLMGAVNHGLAIVRGPIAAAGSRALFDAHGYWFLLQFIFFVDVFFFTVGYLIELPRLRNEIRSVDATLLGWVAALACYPPFNELTAAILGSPFTEFPRFDDPLAHAALNGLLLVALAGYSWASVALGWKASNLTHRGIVARGPYAVVRHPAYVCKMVSWWVASVPLVSLAFTRSTAGGLLAMASVASWALIYVLRAVTEEDHLKRVDGEYAAYAAKVRYRFIPGVV